MHPAGHQVPWASQGLWHGSLMGAPSISQIFSLAWSPDGRQLATVSKDGRLRLYEPRRSPQPQQVGPQQQERDRRAGRGQVPTRGAAEHGVQPVTLLLPTQEGPGPEGGRGARVVWVCGGDFLLVSGFDR